MPDVVITEFMDEAARDVLARTFDVHFDPELHARPEALAALLPTCKALVVRNRTQVSEALIAQAPALVVVGRLGVGLDNIDVQACAARNVAVCPAVGANTDSVAEYVVTMALVLLRGAYASTSAIQAGQWPREQCAGREAQGKVLGLIGFGAIGRATARRASALGLSVIAFDANIAADDPSWRECAVTPVDFAGVLQQSDAISLHVPLNPSTRHLLNADAIARMKPGAILINTARGGIVDESALAAALEDGRLAGAAVDVFEEEPPGANSPLNNTPNVILTPHVAGVTVESNVRVGDVVARAVIDKLEQAG